MELVVEKKGSRESWSCTSWGSLETGFDENEERGPVAGFGRENREQGLLFSFYFSGSHGSRSSEVRSAARVGFSSASRRWVRETEGESQPIVRDLGPNGDEEGRRGKIVRLLLLAGWTRDEREREVLSAWICRRKEEDGLLPACVCRTELKEEEESLAVLLLREPGRRRRRAEGFGLAVLENE